MALDLRTTPDRIIDLTIGRTLLANNPDARLYDQSIGADLTEQYLNGSLSIFGTLSLGAVGSAFSFVPTVSGGLGNRAFSLAGSLPSGLSFSSATGAITGTPTRSDVASGLAITVKDSFGQATLSGQNLLIGQEVSVPGGTASQAVSVDNGYYDVYVQGPVASEWKRLWTVTGSVTITPATGDTAWTRARLYGPLALGVNTGDAIGAKMLAGAVFNSRGPYAAGKQMLIGNKATRLSQSPNVFPAHGGFAGSDPAFYYIIDNNGLYKRSRTDWSVVASNTSPFTGLSNVNHFGGGKYYSGNLYVALANWGGSCGAASNANGQIARYRASDLAFVDTHVLTDIVDQSVSGLAIDATGGVIYVTTYCDASRIYRYDLTTFAPLGPVTVPIAFDQIQDATFKAGRLYLACQIEGTAIDTIAILTPDGKFVGEMRPTDWTGTMEGLDFDVASGNLGIVSDDQATTCNVNFYADATSPVLAQTGWSSAKTHFGHFVDTELSAAGGTIFTRFAPNTLYDFNEIWDNTGNQTNYEGWVPSTGSITGRVSGTTRTFALGATTGTPITYAHAWDATSEALFVNGSDRVAVSVTTPAWPTNADIGLAGVNSANGLGDNTYAYGYVFSSKLSEAEKQAVQTDPSRVVTPTNALTSGQKALVQAS